VTVSCTLADAQLLVAVIQSFIAGSAAMALVWVWTSVRRGRS